MPRPVTAAANDRAHHSDGQADEEHLDQLLAELAEVLANPVRQVIIGLGCLVLVHAGLLCFSR
ncbi:hypothetical protein [Thioalkalivibrio sp.]|uniref:hypothetical protein n=1 Tax=Thioalkalivibrio sp. TaxID=2093813 RepID=UPI0012D5D560|nr:hypothetical protein [Thioalkalivibrio sp.]TVP78257.1 MAG: hypothetical protein EA346_11750 [Thioalkalivibrio sp.]